MLNQLSCCPRVGINENFKNAISSIISLIRWLLQLLSYRLFPVGGGIMVECSSRGQKKNVKEEWDLQGTRSD